MKHCKLCPAEIPLGRQIYCDVCSAYMRKLHKCESEKRRYQKNRKEPVCNIPIILEKDPSDAPLVVGMTIPVEEHKWMKELKTYTPGTVIRQGDERKRIDLVNGRMVEVRI